MFSVSRSFWERNGGAFSSIKRWKGGKSKPNMNAMKKLKNFCDIHDVGFTTLEEQWND